MPKSLKLSIFILSYNLRFGDTVSKPFAVINQNDNTFYLDDYVGDISDYQAAEGWFFARFGILYNQSAN